MASKGYATVNEVADFMGATFSAAQQAIAGFAISAAEKWLDTNTRHAWLEVGPITEDVLVARSSIIRVTKPPVKEFTNVWGILWPGGTPFLLDAAYGQYNVRSLRDGEVLVAGAAGYGHHRGGYSVRVEYIPNDDAVPDEVRLATMTLAAASLRMVPTFNDDVDPTLVQSYVVGGELEVVFRKNILTSGAAAQQALGYMDAWTKNYVVL